MTGFNTFGGGGFGMLQNGGIYGGPVGMAQMRDPRYHYAQSLIAQGADTSPVRTPMAGIGRAAQGIAGALIAKSANDQYAARQADYARAVSNALGAAQGTPAETKTYANNGDPTTINWNAVPPNPQAMTNILAANPDTAPMALQQTMQQIALQQKAQIDYINDLRGKGLMPGPNGGVVPIPNYGKGVGSVKADEIGVTGPAEANAAGLKTGATQAAELPYVGPRAAAAAAATLPYDVAKAGQVEAAQLGARNAPTPIIPPGQTAPMNVPAASVVPIVTKYGEQGATQGQQNTGFEEKMADDFRAEPAVKNYQAVVPIYNSMVDAAGKNTRASDLNLVYGLAKIMDPTSVVREGEMVMVNNTAALPDWLVGQINRVNGGAGLQPETRNAVMAEASSRANNYKAQFDQAASQYGDIASRRGLKPENIIIRPTELTKFEQLKTPPTVGATQDGYRFLGGDPANPKSWQKM